MINKSSNPMTGGCDCGHVRYQVKQKPMYVHCCHCSWCQRETGAAFALNAIVESSEILLLAHKPNLVQTPSASGRGQKIARCSKCHVALWSHYAGMDEWLSFIKVGTLDDVNQMPPDIHIFTSTKQDWFKLPDDGTPVFQNYYDRKKLWSESSLARFERLMELKNE